MKELAEFEVKVYATKDKKKLKKGSKTYSYGTISIRDPRLTEYVGKRLRVKAYSMDETVKPPAQNETKEDRRRREGKEER